VFRRLRVGDAENLFEVRMSAAASAQLRQSEETSEIAPAIAILNELHRFVQTLDDDDAILALEVTKDYATGFLTAIAARQLEPHCIECGRSAASHPGILWASASLCSECA
jgi:hypothetical protein